MEFKQRDPKKMNQHKAQINTGSDQGRGEPFAPIELAPPSCANTCRMQPHIPEPRPCIPDTHLSDRLPSQVSPSSSGRWPWGWRRQSSAEAEIAGTGVRAQRAAPLFPPFAPHHLP